MRVAAILQERVRGDANLRRGRKLVAEGIRALPSATGRYLIQKVPVVQWIIKYSPRWLINDLIAGLTVGVILIPQALAYAKIATIPLQDGLLASWLPSVIYLIMGTSKDISIGPTSIIGLTTAQVIKDVSAEGNFTPTATAIAVAISFSVGIYSLVLGLFKLGWLLELISLPVLSGFISAAAITIIAGQIPAIFGEVDIGSGVANQIHDIFAKLGVTKPITLAIGISGIILLCILQFMGEKWGKKNKGIWVLSIGRNAIVILFFTIISFVVNHKRKVPLFDLTGKIPSGIVPPSNPNLTVVGKVFTKSLVVFIASALEHIAIAKAFGRRNGYAIDQSQELNSLGFINLLNSIFGGMAVGGAFSRTAVNSESGVKSPLSGLLTTSTVLISIYALTGALFWIPKATLSAVIIVAVYQVIVPVSVFHSYWKTSVVDFVGSQLSFWITLFVSAEMGIEISSAFMIAYSVARMVFTKAEAVGKKDFGEVYPGRREGRDSDELPAGIQILKICTPIIFLSSTSLKSSILNAVQTYHSSSSTSSNPDRLWNELSTQRISLLRRKVGISPEQAHELPRLNVLILDMENVNYVDSTGLQALREVKSEVKAYGGEGVDVRFVVGERGEVLRERFARAGWELFMGEEESGRVRVRVREVEDGEKEKDRDECFRNMREAIAVVPGERGSSGWGLKRSRLAG